MQVLFHISKTQAGDTSWVRTWKSRMIFSNLSTTLALLVTIWTMAAVWS